jgi:hypothetical protein
MRVASTVLLISAWLCSCVPCEPERLDDAASAPPGEVRHGLTFGAVDMVNVIQTASGVACVTCGGILYFDQALREQRRVDVRLAGEPRDVLFATSGDTTIVLDRDLPQWNDDPSPRDFQLFALSAAGEELWRHDLGGGDEFLSAPGLVAGPASVVVVDRDGADVFDPASGALRYSIPVEMFGQVTPDSSGGLFLSGSALSFDGRPAQTTVRRLDATGGQIWAATWTDALPPTNSDSFINCAAVAPTPDGGFIVAVSVTGPTLDLGERQLQGSAPEDNLFMVALAADGAVEWTVALGNAAGSRLLIVATPGGAILGGSYSGSNMGLGLPYADSPDAFVARVDRTGQVAAHAIGGSGYQGMAGLAAESDGSVNVLVLNTFDDGRGGVMHIGNRTFDDTGGRQFYLLNILP